MDAGPRREDSISAKLTPAIMKNTGVHSLSHNACLAPEFLICFLFRSQRTSPKPAILDAHRDSLNVALTPSPSIVLFSSLRLLLPSLLDPLKYVLPILVKLQFRNDDFAWRNPDWRTRPIRLLSRDSFNVDNVFETVDGGDLAIAAFMPATDYGNFIVFANRDGANLW